MESGHQGNVEPKRSAFKIRTKVGSQQGLRQSSLITEGHPGQLKPMSKLEDRQQLGRDHKLVPPSTLMQSKDMTESQLTAEPRKIIGVEEIDEQDIVEKGDGYLIQNFKAKQPSIKNPGSIKMSRTYQYDDMEIFATRFSPDDTLLAIGLSNGCIDIKQLSSNKKGELVKTSPDELPISHIRWKNNKRVLVANVEGFLIEYDIESCAQVASVKEDDNQILALDFTAELGKIVTAGKDANIRIYDDNNKRLVRTYEKGSWVSPGHVNRIFSTKFKNNDPNILISGGWDSSVFIWDIRQPKCVTAFVGPNISGDTIDTRDDVILTGSHRAKDSLELWDFKTTKKICDVEIEPGRTVDNSYVYACQFSKTGDDQIIAGMAVRNEIRIFDRNITYTPSWAVSKFDRAIYTLDWGNKGKKVAFGGGSGRAYVFKYLAGYDRG